jgi:hypothetical protein
MMGIHNMFPPDDDGSNNPISERKLIKDEGRYSTRKTLLSFNLGGLAQTMWLESAKREKLFTILKSWIEVGTRGTAGIPFKAFESAMAKNLACIYMYPGRSRAAITMQPNPQTPPSLCVSA